MLCSQRRGLYALLLAVVLVATVSLLVAQGVARRLRWSGPRRPQSLLGSATLYLCDGDGGDSSSCRDSDGGEFSSGGGGAFLPGVPSKAVRGGPDGLHTVLTAAAYLASPPQLIVLDGALARDSGVEAAVAGAAAVVPPARIAYLFHSSGAPPTYDSTALYAVVHGVENGSVAAVAFTDCHVSARVAALSYAAPTVLSLPPAQPVHVGTDKFSLDDGAVHVGVVGDGDLLLHLAALCPLQHVVVHLFVAPAELPVASRCRAAIIAHGALPLADAVLLLPRLDAAVDASSTACAPPAVLAAIAAGVPCVVSSAVTVYQVDDALQAALVVPTANDVAALRDAVARLAAPGVLSATAYRVKGLAHWLAAEAPASRIAFVAAAVSSPTLAPRPPYVPWQAGSPPPELPKLPPGAALPRMAFYATELTPATPGGAGVVIAALVHALLARRQPVVLVGNFGASLLARWCHNATAGAVAASGEGARFRLTCYDLPTVVADAGVPPPVEGLDTFSAAGVELAYGMREVHRRTPFDVLELFDYGGVGYELLRSRTEVALSSGGDSLRRRGGAPAPAAAYLPPSVRIAVRLHGSLELIDAAEGVADSPASRHMHYMEQVALEGADWLLPLTGAMGRTYARVYNLNPARMLVAPPPMSRVLAPVMSGPLDHELPEGVEAAVYGALSKCQPAAGCRILLVPGKLQDNKGTHTVAAALAELRAPTPGPPTDVHFVFLGTDLPCPAHGALMSACIHRLAGAAAEHATILPALPRTAYRWLVTVLSPLAAIVASKFETFNLAARELLALRVPAIVSNIAAFDDLAPNLVEFFSRGDAHSLATAVVAARRRWEAGLNGDGMEYGDALAPYAVMASTLPPPVHPLPMLHAAIATTAALLV